MRTNALGLVAVLVVTTASFADEDGIKAELRCLEGTWQLVSATKDGKETPKDVVKKIRVVIKDNKHSVYSGNEIVAKEIPFTLDPKKKPKTTTDKLPDGKELNGIYNLDADTLISCVAELGKDRPSEFAAKPGSGHTLRVFKRVKP
jgi:uncharacterized protein (TIGR03067 family)